ncbi:hypothetical protein KDL01_39855 [Actinospica durhamensis]|uniref:Uncharacterized protein n=1 Tax=Actinospica durhamensis TaxID=1508375 RepID=A0A941F1L2_9ACTN|nr:hypothetical protein [Actinospica durhamensis]MBR7839479.1 hypothetical protein [Actinospica durhamensis]
MTDGVRAPRLLVDTRAAAPTRLVTLNMRADKDYLALARTCAMHTAAVLGFPLSRVTDLRLAVNEACLCFLEAPVRRGSDLLGSSPAPAALEIAYDLYPEELHVTLRSPVPENWPRVDETGWALLRALVGDVRVFAHEGLGTLTLIEPLPAPTR